MAHSPSSVVRAKLFRFFVIPIFIIGIVGTILAISQGWFWFQFDLPSYEPVGKTWLGILSWRPGRDGWKVRDLWVVDLSAQKKEPKKIAVIDELPANLVDCRQFSANLCVAGQSDDNKAVYTLYRYDLLTPSNSSLTPLDFTAISSKVNKDSIITVTPKGVVFWFQGMLYLKSEETITVLYDLAAATDCPSPVSSQISPDGAWLAVLCTQEDWNGGRYDPRHPMHQTILVVNLETSEQTWLEMPPVYFFHAATMVFPLMPPFDSIKPQVEWSPTGDEILFTAAFSPPEAHNPGDWLKYHPGTAEGIETINHAGIYSISRDEKTLTKWADVGGWNPSLSWSPDHNFVAYTCNENFYIASRQGKHHRIDLPDNFHLHNDTPETLGGWLTWSPDGAYIAFLIHDISDEQSVWILSTQDYSWQRVDIPPDLIDDMIWVTAAP